MLNINGITTADFDSSLREIRAKIDIFFDGPENTPVTIEDDLIESFGLLEESGAETANPLGHVSANELEFRLDNRDGRFSPSAGGLYADKIDLNVLVRIYVQPAQKTTTEWVPMGTYFVADWKSDFGDTSVTVLCYDRLALLSQLPIPPVKVTERVTINYMFNELFQALGLTHQEYKITGQLGHFLHWGWIPQGTVLNALQTLAEASFCSVLVDRAGIIRVLPNDGILDTGVTLTDDNQIISASVPQSILKTYTGVQVQHNRPFIGASTTLDQFTTEVGTSGLTINKSAFSGGPMAWLDYVKCSDASVVVSGVSLSPWEASMTLTATKDMSVTVETVGRPVVNSFSIVEKLNTTAVSKAGTKLFTLNNPLIQQKSDAEDIADKLLRFVSSYESHVHLEVRGNPLLEIGDVISVQDDYDGINMQVKITRMSFNYDGTLDCTIEGVNTKILEVTP